MEQCGLSGLQRFWPKATSKSLSTIQYRLGSFSLKAISVSSGPRVATYPRRFEIR